jgi:hypothetical protein
MFETGRQIVTKVILSPSVLGFRQAMTDLVQQVCDEHALAAVGRDWDPELEPDRTDVVELGIPGLLRPPKIEMVWPSLRLKDGCLYGIIQIHTSEYFGVMNVYVILEDEQGNHIEGGYALDNDYVENHWGYFASAPASPGTTIVVRVLALDKLGGIAIHTEKVTV